MSRARGCKSQRVSGAVSAVLLLLAAAACHSVAAAADPFVAAVSSVNQPVNGQTVRCEMVAHCARTAVGEPIGYTCTRYQPGLVCARLRFLALAACDHRIRSLRFLTLEVLNTRYRLRLVHYSLT